MYNLFAFCKLQSYRPNPRAQHNTMRDNLVTTRQNSTCVHFYPLNIKNRMPKTLNIKIAVRALSTDVGRVE